MRLPRRTLLAAPAMLLGRPSQGAEPRTLNCGVVSDPVTLDPAFSASFFEVQVLFNLHETLLVVSPEGQVMPGLASLATPDPLTYVLTLRPNLTYHDGTAVDAASAKANIERYLDPKVGSLRKADFGPIAGVEVNGPLVFTIKLSAPYAPLPLVLTTRAGMLVSMQAVTALGPDFATHAVGCGAFKFVSWTKNSELVLEKFPGYWRGNNHGFDRISFRPIADETVRLANLRSGTLQLIDSVPAQAIAQIGRETTIKVAQMPGVGFNAWSLNCTRAPFNNAAVRRAFVQAVDPEIIQRVVYFGTGRVSHGPLSPAVAWAFDPTFSPPMHDPAAAKKALEAAGITTPLPISITTTNSPQMVRTAQIIQAQAAEAGFKVEVKQIDPTSLITVLRARDFDVCMSPWSGRYDPDGNTFFWFSKGGPNNFAGYDSDAMTTLLGRARSETDQATRAILYHDAQILLAQDAPLLFVHFDAILQASAAGLKWTQYPDATWRLYDATLA